MRHMHPKLSHSILAGLALLALMLGLSLSFALPLLNDIVYHANALNERHLPDITRWRQNTQRAEKLYGLINTLYWTTDAEVARNHRLQAQVLVNSFSYEPTPYLSPKANSLFKQMRAIEQIHQQQRQLIRQINQSAQALSGQLTQTTPAQNAFLQMLSYQALQVGPYSQLQQQATELFSQDESVQAPQLAELETQLSQLEPLHQAAKQHYETALQAQQELVSLLTTDTTLALKKIAETTRKKAEQTRQLGLGILIAFSALLFMMLLMFQRFILRPIFNCSRALQALNEHHDPKAVIAPPHTLFRELEMINQNVRHYIDLTDQLQQLSNKDELTGLANRRHFDQALETELRRTARHHHALSLIMLDIDHFKRLNDTYGHPFGDLCLQTFAKILQQCGRRSSDLVARYGGEEFMLLLPEISLEESHAIAEQILTRTAALELTANNGDRVHMTVSAGMLYLDSPSAGGTDALLRSVDKALYKAKADGRNRIVTAQLKS